MVATAIFDSSVLYPSLLRDVLIRVAQRGVVRARWTDHILDEVFRSLIRDRPHLDEAKLQRTRILMNEAIRDVVIDGYTDLIPDLTLPDPDDRHVLAAAIHAGADWIVTSNLRHFPTQTLAVWNISARHPDDFLMEHITAHPDVLGAIVRELSEDTVHPHLTPGQVLDGLSRCGAGRTAHALASLLLE